MRSTTPWVRAGMATVFRATDLQTKQTCAVKLLHPSTARSPKIRRRFLAEATTMAALEHPNVVRVLSVGHDDGHYYIVMELAQGGSIADYCREHGQRSPHEALALGFQVLQGLDFAHTAGVVHRDVKPHNMLLQEVPDPARDPRLALAGAAPGRQADGLRHRKAHGQWTGSHHGHRRHAGHARLHGAGAAHGPTTCGGAVRSVRGGSHALHHDHGPPAVRHRHGVRAREGAGPTTGRGTARDRARDPARGGGPVPVGREMAEAVAEGWCRGSKTACSPDELMDGFEYDDDTIVAPHAPEGAHPDWLEASDTDAS